MFVLQISQLHIFLKPQKLHKQLIQATKVHQDDEVSSWAHSLGIPFHDNTPELETGMVSMTDAKGIYLGL